MCRYLSVISSQERELILLRITLYNVGQSKKEILRVIIEIIKTVRFFIAI